MNRVVWATAAFLMLGCATVPAASGPTAAIGEVAATGGPLVRPLAILEDSRCPATVQSVWEGRLIARAEIIGGNWRTVQDLTLSVPLAAADGTLTLVAVEPAKIHAGAIDSRAYRFTFRFD